MFIKVNIGEELQYFSQDTFQKIRGTIGLQVLDHIEKNPPNKDEGIVGGFVMTDIPLLDGSKQKVWVEWNLILDEKLDCTIHELIIFDEVDDKILDRYNNLKKLE